VTQQARIFEILKRATWATPSRQKRIRREIVHGPIGAMLPGVETAIRHAKFRS
jgi:hypothetical protein